MFSSNQLSRKHFWRGFIAAIPIMISLIPFALVLGAQATQKGLAAYEITLLTAVNFAGGSEFVAINLWTFPPQVLLITLMTFLVNSRHLLMGAALTPYLKDYPKRKVLPALFLMCDESWAMGFADAKKSPDQRFNFPYYMGACIGLYFVWIACATIGALTGPMIGDLTVYGFDMAFVAVFLVLIKGMWKGFKEAIPWLISLTVAIVSYQLLAGAWYVMLGAFAGLFTAFIMAHYD